MHVCGRVRFVNSSFKKHKYYLHVRTYGLQSVIQLSRVHKKRDVATGWLKWEFLSLHKH